MFRTKKESPEIRRLREVAADCRYALDYFKEYGYGRSWFKSGHLLDLCIEGVIQHRHFIKTREENLKRLPVYVALLAEINGNPSFTRRRKSSPGTIVFGNLHSWYDVEKGDTRYQGNGLYATGTRIKLLLEYTAKKYEALADAAAMTPAEVAANKIPLWADTHQPVLVEETPKYHVLAA